MSPLVIREKKQTSTLNDGQLFPLSWWRRKLGFGASETISGAASRGDVELVEGEPYYPGHACDKKYQNRRFSRVNTRLSENWPTARWSSFSSMVS